MESVKVKFNGDIRRRSIPANLPLAHFHQELIMLFGASLPEYTLQTVLPGNKFVNITTEEEWKRVLTEFQRPTLSIEIVPRVIEPIPVPEKSNVAREQLQTFFEETLPEAIAEGSNGIKNFVETFSATMTNVFGTVMENSQQFPEVSQGITQFASKVKEAVDGVLGTIPNLSPNVSSDVKHSAVCDHCNKNVTGIRYKCSICPDFDLCEICEALENVHDPTHVFFKIKNPELNVDDFFVLDAKYEFKFIRDISVSDKALVQAGACFTKTWLIQNSGDVAWPRGTKVQFVGGKQFSQTQQVLLPALRPKEQIEVSVDMQAPTTPGLHTSFWNVFFPGGVSKGPERLWCCIMVPDLFPYQQELKQILPMGWPEDLVRALLLESKGNVQVVVDELLNQ